MADYEIKDPKEITTSIRKLERTDPNDAELFNQINEKLINNDAFLNEKIIQLKEFLNYMPINGGNFDGNEPNGVLIDGGIY
ncbi:hypothetical protein SAMN00017405_0375 [Desulfonispora thiosulfatigenes DSM 11270]|uniref:Uncharacterized protein n=1 Tax=Desulfonispora thiosulfatigenes DSM 11270 TaxID=656914 RepID=A0A1W1VPP6_DESTI|nr:hypothetical protein [Desulfonispora thiosulfatigenes]SMB95306.1 hypothetical protein SAMN00017405_0375 [Desulfonispora thiosulfatigenes DSM 11270]